MTDKLNPSIKNIEHLHIIRGVAALLVVIFHSRFILWCGGTEFAKSDPGFVEKIIAYTLMMLFSSGVPMVICFFVLSGFFLKMSFENNTLLKFYSNRLIRIYIPYVSNSIFAILILYLSFTYINPQLKTSFDTTKQIAVDPLLAFNELSLKTFFKSLLFLPSTHYIAWNNQYWSLLQEAIFYISLPLLMYNKRIVFILSLVAYGIGFLYSSENPLLKYLLNYLLFFQVGICLHLIINSEWVKRVFYKKHNAYILSLIAILYISLNYFAIKNSLQLANMLGGILTVVTIFLLYHQPNLITKGVLFKWLTKLGEISFSLYLAHFIILFLIYAIITRVTGTYLIYKPVYLFSLPIVILFSYIFYQLVEKQSIRLKKHFTNKL